MWCKYLYRNKHNTHTCILCPLAKNIYIFIKKDYAMRNTIYMLCVTILKCKVNLVCSYIMVLLCCQLVTCVILQHERDMGKKKRK